MTTPERNDSWTKVQLARHTQRPHALDYIRSLCRDFFELRGDRSAADDQAIVGGIGRTELGAIVVLGHQKGHGTRERLQHHFGMPAPEGYRKALRLMRYAETFQMPLVCLLDTPGAQPTPQAEAHGQAQAIAQNLLAMSGLSVPIVAVVTGEASSGGALAIGICDRLLMLEHAIYTVASPEACAAILWRDAGKAAEAAAALRLTAQDLLALAIVDEIVAEPAGGAQHDPPATVAAVCEAILRQLRALGRVDPADLLTQRAARYRSIGRFYDQDQPLAAALPATRDLDAVERGS